MTSKKKSIWRKLILAYKASGGGGGAYNTFSGSIIRFLASKAAPIRSIIASIAPVQAGSGDPSSDNVRPISGWTAANIFDEAEYDATATPKLTIPFTVNGDTQTIYGGTVSVDENGKVKLTADKALYYVDGSVSVIGVSYYQITGLYYTSVTNSIRGINTTASEPHLLSNRFDAKNRVEVGNTYITSLGMLLVAVLPDQTATTKELATAWFSSNPTQFVYDLAEPVEYDLSDVTVLSTLQGTNVMWADCGDITVTARGAEIPEPELTAQQSLDLLLGGRYVNNHEADEPSDDEALSIIMGGNNR